MQNIGSLYRLSLAEGEGIGTAYEYRAKRAKLNRFLRAVGRPVNILIAGLPERYGYSMDFFLLAHELQAEVVVVDERADRLRRAGEILGALSAKNILRGASPRFEVTADLSVLPLTANSGRGFDLALSCEVAQRLGAGRDRYFAALRQSAANVAVFAPNGQNQAHNLHSGLRSVPLDDLIRAFAQREGGFRVHDMGYLDMPPFPPGISRSQEKRDQAAESIIERWLMSALDIYCSGEQWLPAFVKARHAHIAYVMASVDANRAASTREGSS